jgi:hypothetical protein
MGLFDSATSTSTTTKYPKYNEGQSALLAKLIQRANAGLTTGAEKYSGDMYAKENPYETSYMNWDSPQAKTIQAALDTVLSGKAAYDINEQTTQDYWDKYMAPMVAKQQRALNEQYAPGIFSGGRDIAQGEFSAGVTGEYGKLQYADELARRTALTEAANRQANTVNTAYANEATREKNTAEMARSIEEAKLAGDYQRWMSGEADANGVVNQSANPYRLLALSLLGTSPYVYGSNVDSIGSGLGYGALTGLSSGLGSLAASGLASLGTSGLNSLLAKLFSSGSGFSLSDSDLSSLLSSNNYLSSYDDLFSGVGGTDYGTDYDFSDWLSTSEW